MGFFDFFKTKIINRFSKWSEIGTYHSVFTTFGGEIYRNDLVRSCIRPLADFTSKANIRCSDARIEKVLNERPNLYMDGKAFLLKVRTLFELRNNVFIYIQRDDRGHATGFYPIPYQRFEALEYNNRLFIRFYFKTAERELTLPWSDLAVLRKDYNESDISGDENTAVIATLQMLTTVNEGTANAIRATANLRGILKSTKAMLSDADLKKKKDDFVKDYLNLENEGGIASLDATQEFTPITMSPMIANSGTVQELRENIYRYFGVNDDIVMAKMTPDQIEAFYEMRIEPFLVALSSELTSKTFTERERAFGNWIIAEANKLQFASLTKKIQMFATVVQYGGMTVNEWRAACNMAPIEGGDELIRRLDAAPVTEEEEDEENANQ